MHVNTDIIIPVHDALMDFEECLKTVCENTQNYRLIVVNDYSCDSESRIRKLTNGYAPRNSLYIETFKQRWFTRAINLGLRMARTEWVVTINSDCVVGPGWLDELYEVIYVAQKELGSPVGLVGDHHTPDCDKPEHPRWKAENVANGGSYVTGHCWLLNMAAANYIAQKRGTPGWILDETRQDSIHINSDRFLSYDMNYNGFATVYAYKAKIGHKGGKSWNYNLQRINGLSLREVND